MASKRETKRRKEERRSDCPIGFALDAFGDRWTLLVVRDLLLQGKKTYGEFLASEEKIATNILAERLDWLKCRGIVQKEKDKTNRRKIIYHLTRKGLDLLPVMLEMVKWSWKYDPKTGTPPAFAKRLLSDREGLIRDILSGAPVGVPGR